MHSKDYVNGKLIVPIKTIDDSDLYDWEKEIIEIIKNEPDDRTIYWFWEPTGCTGKTTFAKYLYIKHGAIQLKKKRMIYCIVPQHMKVISTLLTLKDH